MKLVSLAAQFQTKSALSTVYFIVLQDHPDQGTLYLVRGLLNVIQDYTWDINGDAKITIYLNAIGLLSALSQVSENVLRA